MKQLSIGLLLGAVIGGIAVKATFRRTVPNLVPTQTSLPKPQPINGMAQNEREMKKLGDSMKKVPTNTQVAESGMVPDPIQYEKE